MEYSPALDKIILFGGFVPPFSTSDQTWEFDCKTNEWTQLSPATKPSARYSHSMWYDDTNNVILLFGGTGAGGNQNNSYMWLGTTWLLWTPGGTKPAARYGQTCVHDIASGKAYLFGGYDSTPTWYADTWEWTTSPPGWVQLSPTNSPSWRRDHVSWYDHARDKVVVYGGVYTGNTYKDTWEFDGTDWTDLGLLTCPHFVHSGAAVYGYRQCNALMFGGRPSATGTTYLDNTYEARANLTTFARALNYLHLYDTDETDAPDYGLAYDLKNKSPSVAGTITCNTTEHWLMGDNPLNMAPLGSP
jgi:hypothetical protein